MSAQNWITFLIIVGLCLIPLGIVGYLDWRTRQRDRRILAAHRAAYQDWQRTERLIHLATLQGPAKKGIDARRHSVVGVREKKETA